jgi:hypothetical protein
MPTCLPTKLLPPCPALRPPPQIYNNVANGFGDANAYLRELTLKSMAVLGPKLSQRTINQSLLKHLAKLQASSSVGCSSWLPSLFHAFMHSRH